VHQPGGGVQHAVAQPLGFGGGQVAVEAEDLQPSDEVTGDGRGDAPGGVDGELAGSVADLVMWTVPGMWRPIS
jgi:hypothetical protein